MLCLKLLNISELPRCGKPPVMLLCPPVYLLGHFPSFRYVQGSTSAGPFERWVWNIGTCQPGLPVPLFTFCSKHIDLWERWHVWSDCYFLRQSTEWKQSLIKSVDHTCIKSCHPDNVCDSPPFHKATRMCESWGLIMNGFVFICTSNADFR